jgi:hypothetical protein
VDIDWHGPASTAPDVNLRAALAWYDRLASLGFRPLLTDSNGQGGFHLVMLLAEPVETAGVYYFLQALVGDHARHGMTTAPETFPKQPRVAPPGQNGQYGNWLRLPGRHHTRAHWSRVWDGARWLQGHQAIDHILSLAGDSPALVPEPRRPEPRLRRPEPRPPLARHAPAPEGDLAARVAAHLARLPNLGEGQGRDDVAYHFACWLVRDLRLPDAEALAWLGKWDRGNRPPKGPDRLREVLAGAHRYGRNAYGSGLGPGPARPGRPRSGSHKTKTIHFTVEV